MQNNYYNYMLNATLRKLKEMVTMNDPKTMIQYKTLSVKDWDAIKTYIEPLNDFSEDKRSQAMEYYSKHLYPLLKSGEIKRFGFKKLYAIKVDDYDFRQILSNCQNLIR